MLVKGGLGFKGAMGMLGIMKMGILGNINPIDTMSEKYGLGANNLYDRFTKKPVSQTGKGVRGTSVIGRMGMEVGLEQEMGSAYSYSDKALKNMEL
jgi:hypothetical protein